MEKQDDVLDPCQTCLVRVCCSETCQVLIDFIVGALNYIVENPNDEEALVSFSEEQKRLIRSTADKIRRNKDEEKK